MKKLLLSIGLSLFIFTTSIASEGKIIQYIVIREDNISNLTTLVNSYINTGWEPLGGLALQFPNCTKPWYHQVIVLKSIEKDSKK